VLLGFGWSVQFVIYVVTFILFFLTFDENNDFFFLSFYSEQKIQMEQSITTVRAY